MKARITVPSWTRAYVVPAEAPLAEAVNAVVPEACGTLLEPPMAMMMPPVYWKRALLLQSRPPSGAPAPMAITIPPEIWKAP